MQIDVENTSKNFELIESDPYVPLYFMYGFDAEKYKGRIIICSIETEDVFENNEGILFVKEFDLLLNNFKDVFVSNSYNANALEYIITAIDILTISLNMIQHEEYKARFSKKGSNDYLFVIKEDASIDNISELVHMIGQILFYISRNIKADKSSFEYSKGELEFVKNDRSSKFMAQSKDHIIEIEINDC